MGTSLSEEFKDQKINDILEDYIALEKQMHSVVDVLKRAIDETPERFDSVLSSKINELIQSAQEFDQEIEKEKVEIKETGVAVKDKLTSEIVDLISSLKSSQDKIYQTYQKQLESVASAAKPFSTSKAIGICAACTLFLSAAFSGAFWYVAQSQKEQDLRMYATGYMNMRTLTLDTIKQLPKDKQDDAKRLLANIDNAGK